MCYMLHLYSPHNVTVSSYLLNLCILFLPAGINERCTGGDKSYSNDGTVLKSEENMLLIQRNVPTYDILIVLKRQLSIFNANVYASHKIQINKTQPW